MVDTKDTAVAKNMKSQEKEFEMQMLPSYQGRGQPKYTEENAESAESLQNYYGSENSQSQSKPYYVAGKKGNRYTEYR